MFTLDSIKEKDLELVLTWRNSENVRRCMLNEEVITWQEHCSWFKKLKNRNDQEFLIYRIENRPVGVISFRDIDTRNNHCKWGFYIGEPTAPKGAGTLMAYHAISYMFEKYQLHKINSEVIAFNKISLDFHEKLGFFQTGIWKENLLRNHIYYDLIILSLFQNDWEKIKEKIYFKALKHVKGGKRDV